MGKGEKDEQKSKSNSPRNKYTYYVDASSIRNLPIYVFG